MKISDIFRKIADVIDHEEHAGRPDAAIQNPAELSAASAGLPVDHVDNADAGADDEVFVPPLQRKLELLKRAVGVDNVYDDQRADEVEGNNDDALAALKRNAGLAAVVQSEAADDEPLE